MITGASLIGVASVGPQQQASSGAGAALAGIILVAYLVVIIIWVGYMVYFTGTSGQTVGKKAMKIKVIRKDGSPVGVGYALLRETVGKYISALVLNLGYLWMLWDQEKQTWHDKIAGTLVVKT